MRPLRWMLYRNESLALNMNAGVGVTEEREVRHQGSYEHDDRAEPHAPYQHHSPAVLPQSAPAQVRRISPLDNQATLWIIPLPEKCWNLMNNQTSSERHDRLGRLSKLRHLFWRWGPSNAFFSGTARNSLCFALLIIRQIYLEVFCTVTVVCGLASCMDLLHST